ncbi:hypothetical protein RFI_10902 [Reticulomyxa filosa]|uniref:Uncharacterized protein n=1 Tax=Reticulomyxa filosa TaxID=46433 RepID=X6NKG7_RETFI|nr:hypothetical protein RFI_10902 [Reticulomyxa filosa]|eukprot:ETO26234.1 hypothetical protein RFI_10902 [Reticulomyxa filosa]
MKNATVLLSIFKYKEMTGVRIECSVRIIAIIAVVAAIAICRSLFAFVDSEQERKLSSMEEGKLQLVGEERISSAKEEKVLSTAKAYPPLMEKEQKQENNVLRAELSRPQKSNSSLFVPLDIKKLPQPTFIIMGTAHSGTTTLGQVLQKVCGQFLHSNQPETFYWSNCLPIDQLSFGIPCIFIDNTTSIGSMLDMNIIMAENKRLSIRNVIDMDWDVFHLHNLRRFANRCSHDHYMTRWGTIAHKLRVRAPNREPKVVFDQRLMSQRLFFEKTPAYVREPHVATILSTYYPYTKLIVCIVNTLKYNALFIPTYTLLLFSQHIASFLLLLLYMLFFFFFSGGGGDHKRQILVDDYPMIKNIRSDCIGSTQVPTTPTNKKNCYQMLTKQLLLYNTYIFHHADDKFEVRGIVSCYYFPLLMWAKVYDLIQWNHHNETVTFNSDLFQTRGHSNGGYLDNIRVIQSELFFKDVPQTIQRIQEWVEAPLYNITYNQPYSCRTSQITQLQYNAHDTEKTSAFTTKLNSGVKKKLYSFYQPCNARLQQLFDIFPFLAMDRFDFSLWENVDN